jgi:hypothetical protein
MGAPCGPEVLPSELDSKPALDHRVRDMFELRRRDFLAPLGGTAAGISQAFPVEKNDVPTIGFSAREHATSRAILPPPLSEAWRREGFVAGRNLRICLVNGLNGNVTGISNGRRWHPSGCSYCTIVPAPAGMAMLANSSSPYFEHARMEKTFDA